MDRFGQLAAVKGTDNPDLDLDLELLSKKLVDFCESHLRNPRAAELDEIVQSCRIED